MITIDVPNFVDPRRNGPYATLAVAVSTYVFAYSTLYGPVSILLYYALWLPWLVFLLPVIRITPTLTVLVGIVAFILASIMWSDQPGTSLRSGLQYASHIACIIVAATIVSFSSLARGLVVGTAFVALYSLFVGRYSYDVLDGTYTLVGAFGSKNSLGFNSSIGAYFALAFWFSDRLPLRDRLIVAIALPVLLLTLWRSQSATSIASLAAAAAVFVVLRVVGTWPPMTRRLASFVGWVVLALSPLVAASTGLYEGVLSIFGKDTTLTGRTYLWAEGYETFLERPWFGLGYQAFWVQGSAPAEQLWQEFYITSRTGFHFHNTFIELLVQLGLLGAIPFIALLVWSFVRCLRRLTVHGDAKAAALCGLALMFLVRAMFEVDTLTAYSIGSFLVLYIWVAPWSLIGARAMPAGFAKPSLVQERT